MVPKSAITEAGVSHLVDHLASAADVVEAVFARARSRVAAAVIQVRGALAPFETLKKAFG